MKKKLALEKVLEHKKTDEDIVWVAVYALKWDKAVPHHTITVMAENGWLVLEGEVNEPQHKSATEAAVSCLPGVAGVGNLVAVKR